jgi:hypothetical protein
MAIAEYPRRLSFALRATDAFGYGGSVESDGSPTDFLAAFVLVDGRG